ncbi:DUF4160 domain-containing protein [Treponema peruense]|uniref:DUF4160 domain-containing protein n=1 Tax=Treponema peruense TaxID=2787628 RepID=UPI0018E0F413
MSGLFSVCSYKIYFWSDKGTEPIHVHVSKGKPSPKRYKNMVNKKRWLYSCQQCCISL